MNKETELTIDEEQMLRLAVEANATERGKKKILMINGKKWVLRSISNRQSALIANLDYDALNFQEQMKSDKLSTRKLKSLNLKFRKIGAKKAAHYVLGRKLWLIPFAYSYMWRKIFNESEEVSATINSSEIIGGKDKDFYLANLGCSKYQLALSTKQVGEAVRQNQERKESAENMLEEDALPKRKQDNK